MFYEFKREKDKAKELGWFLVVKIETINDKKRKRKEALDPRVTGM